MARPTLPTTGSTAWGDTLNKAINDVSDRADLARTEMIAASRLPASGGAFTPTALFQTMSAGQPMPLVGAGSDLRPINSGEPIPVGCVDGVLYGQTGSTLYSSTDDGATWVQLSTTTPNGSIFVGCADGEKIILASSGLYRSQGWVANPATATWTKIITPYADNILVPFGLSGDGYKFILAEYNPTTRANSRYVRISTDMGATWSIVWDASVQFPTETQSHLHATCYDPWDNRFWFVYAHSASQGIYYSENNGATWTRLASPLIDGSGSAPTTMCATDDGIVCGTDSSYPGGILGIRRAKTLKLEVAYVRPVGVAGSSGQSNYSFRDPATGIVYIAVQSQNDGDGASIIAGTAATGNLVWSSANAKSGDNLSTIFVTKSSTVVVNGALIGKTGTQLLYAKAGRVGSPAKDLGVVLGGSVGGGGATAVGFGSFAGGQSSVAVGVKGVATGLRSTAVGAKATASHDDSVAIGQGSTTTNLWQIAGGARHLELDTIAPPSAPPAGKGRLYFDLSSGKVRLIAFFPTKAVVIATEP